jgi:L-lactate dehydrogenase (cytochrome)
MALGAKAVMIGRAYLWGMAANGERGVQNVLSILKSGMNEALLGLGRSSVHGLTRDDVLVPPDFTRDWR